MSVKSLVKIEGYFCAIFATKIRKNCNLPLQFCLLNPLICNLARRIDLFLFLF